MPDSPFVFSENNGGAGWSGRFGSSVPPGSFRRFELDEDLFVLRSLEERGEWNIDEIHQALERSALERWRVFSALQELTTEYRQKKIDFLVWWSKKTKAAELRLTAKYTLWKKRSNGIASVHLSKQRVREEVICTNEEEWRRRKEELLELGVACKRLAFSLRLLQDRAIVLQGIARRLAEMGD